MKKTYLFRSLGALVLIASATFASSPQHIRAQEPGPIQRAPMAAEAVEDDGGTAEVGVEWITDWPGTADDRANWYYSAVNLYNELKDAGWVGKFNWGNTNAWERDFKPGGGNNSLIDTVDLAMIGTHGSSAYDSFWKKNLSSVYFSSNNDDWHLTPGEAYRFFGSNDLEWLAFDSCSVLRDDSRAYWHSTFNGLHLMLGFANTMYVVYPGNGGVWGDQMRKKSWWIFGHGAKTVTQAWFSAVEDQQPSGVRARVLAEELNNYNDYMWGQGYVSPDYPNNGSYWYWDHVSGTPQPLQLKFVPPAMPIYKVQPRVVDDNYAKRVGFVFGLSGEVLQSPDGAELYMAGGVDDTKQLKINTVSGGFSFQDLNELWTDPERARTLPPSGPRAESIATGFLAQYNDQLPGYLGWVQSPVTPTYELEGPTTASSLPGASSLAATEITSPTNYTISYARVLPIGGGQNVSVVGPGARLNVHVGDNGMIAGMKGGWRDVATVQLAGASVQPAAADGANDIQATQVASTPIKTADQAWADFLANPSIAVAQVPLASRYDTTGKPAPTLAYYEQPSSANQSELIPVWIFEADLYTGTVSSGVQATAPNEDVLISSDTKIYVPASSIADALPLVNIVSPVAGAVVNPGEVVTLTAEVTGGLAPYTLVWSSSANGALGTGETLAVSTLTQDMKNGSLQPNTIQVDVIDANGQTASAAVPLGVIGPLRYVPLLLKQ
jgi:hypothetical protein